MSGPSPAASPAPPPEDHRPNPDAARPASFAAIPGWMISGMLHAGLIVFLITSGIPSCGDGQIGTGAETGEFREVGIYVKQPSDVVTPLDESQEDVETPTEPQSTNPTPSKTPSTKVADATAEALIQIPDVQPRGVIGQSRGNPGGGGAISPSEALVTPNGIRSPQSAGQGPGTVSFMGQTTTALTVVYAIDTSSSMNTNGAIEYAKAKLMQSINGLGQDQQFQIIPYALTPSVMHLRNDSAESAPLYRATGPNLTLATQYINSLFANGGTKHSPALREAFRFKPDVIFFLTDAEGGLTPKDLNDVKNDWNKRGKTHIHCIQFGNGADLQTSGSMFFRRLASENRGSFTYIDTSKLQN